MLFLAFLLTFFNFIYCQTQVSSDAPINYKSPDTWPGICTTGRRQSPIDVTNAAVKYFPDMDFNFYDVEKNVQLVSAKQALEIRGFECENDAPHLTESGVVYWLSQIHLHWSDVEGADGSEHAVDGTRQAVEMHLVHRRDNYTSFEEASQHADGFVVVAILVDIAPNNVNQIDELLSNVQHLDPGNESSEVPLKLQANAMLPQNLTNFYRYRGSLTTPGCQEVVQWVVMADAAKISSETLKMMRDFRKKLATGNTGNTRPLQPANDRPVYRRSSDPAVGVVVSPPTVTDALPNSSTAPTADNQDPHNGWGDHLGTAAQNPPGSLLWMFTSLLFLFVC